VPTLDDSLELIGDPRDWPGVPSATAAAARVQAQVAASVGASTTCDETALREAARRELRELIARDDGNTLARALNEAPSLEVARQMWRILEGIDAATDPSPGALARILFAMPVVIVAGVARDTGKEETAHRDAEAPGVAHAPALTLPGLIADTAALAALLREHRALGGCESFALSPALVSADTIDLAHLPALLAASRLDADTNAASVPPLDLPPADLELHAGGEQLHAGGERVFLRFVVGVAMTAARFDALRPSDPAVWGMPVARALRAGIVTPGVSLIVLPRGVQRLAAALRIGRAAQREVAAQVFASNAVRKLRAGTGEPTAIISAHRANETPARGELRLSLSSPFEPRDAEGFRCPLYPYEPVRDVAAMLVALLADCRVTDIRCQPGVHPDIDPATGLRLLFKEAALAPSALH
jgi:hypothetical protein